MSEKERVVNLGELMGKLPAGTGSLTGLKDDRRNKVTPGMYTLVVMNVTQLFVSHYLSDITQHTTTSVTCSSPHSASEMPTYLCHITAVY